MFYYPTRVLAVIAALFAILTAEVGASGTAGVSAVGLSATAVARQSRKAHPAGGAEFRIDSGGVERRYLMYRPKDRADGVPLPVVFDFHGSGSDPEEEMQVSGMADAAERHGFLLLMPVAAVEMPAGGYTWNVPPDERRPDDVQFAMDVLEHAAERVAIDTRRVYVTGFSGGARLASELGCAAPERIAGIAAVGGLRSPTACTGEPVPVVAFHGTNDPINPYDGGGSDYWDYGIDHAVRGWVERNGCTETPGVTRMSGSVVELRYGGCRRGADVVLYRVENGGHTWPGSGYPFPEDRFGELERQLDATRLILEFFALGAPQ